MEHKPPLLLEQKEGTDFYSTMDLGMQILSQTP